MSSYWGVEPITVGEYGVVWIFPSHAALFTQTSIAIPTAAHAHALLDFFEWIVPHFPGGSVATVIHDLRSFSSFPADVRKTFLERRKDMPFRPQRAVIATSMTPLMRMTLQTVTLAIEMFTRSVRIELVDDPGRVVGALGLEPDAALHARLRLSWRRREQMG